MKEPMRLLVNTVQRIRREKYSFVYGVLKSSGERGDKCGGGGKGGVRFDFFIKPHYTLGTDLPKDLK